jgi:hypothetical protein
MDKRIEIAISVVTQDGIIDVLDDAERVALVAIRRLYSSVT